uniref:Uncharacterized protein n=1 Tax=Suricata suricatta TaxID=37032 RepID=A0A673TAS8_SURSU
TAPSPREAQCAPGAESALLHRDSFGGRARPSILSTEGYRKWPDHQPDARGVCGIRDLTRSLVHSFAHSFIGSFLELASRAGKCGVHSSPHSDKQK